MLRWLRPALACTLLAAVTGLISEAKSLHIFTPFLPHGDATAKIVSLHWTPMYDL
jgi:hypothetical protein